MSYLYKISQEAVGDFAPCKILAQHPEDYSLIVIKSESVVGAEEVDDIPNGYEQRCLPMEYGTQLSLQQIDEFVRQEKIRQISSWLERDLNGGVDTVLLDGTTIIKMNAHYEDSPKLKSGHELITYAGLPGMEVCDFHDELTYVSAADVLHIAFQMGANFSAKLAKKWSLRNTVKTIPLEDIDSVVWEDSVPEE